MEMKLAKGELHFLESYYFYMAKRRSQELFLGKNCLANCSFFIA